ncbi:hypothetical protein F5146DRAFT_927245, partial [Armillaria mellea]
NKLTEHAARYTPFNIMVLKNMACESVNAQQCTKISKITEGCYNKVFLLDFDSGIQAIARIPSPIIGNMELCIQSEIATMTFLREYISEMAAPKVMAWDATSLNPVMFPFIVIEYILGISDGEYWLDITSTQFISIMASMIKLQRKLDTPFSQIGSLYFVEDVGPELQSCPLFMDEEINREDIAQKYRIGSIVNHEWWCRGRMHVVHDRGPCTLIFILSSLALNSNSL